MYAAVDESTPPDMATATFTALRKAPSAETKFRKAPVVHAVNARGPDKRRSGGEGTMRAGRRRRSEHPPDDRGRAETRRLRLLRSAQRQGSAGPDASRTSERSRARPDDADSFRMGRAEGARAGAGAEADSGDRHQRESSPRGCHGGGHRDLRIS